MKRFAKTAPKSVAYLEDGFDDATSVLALPEKYRRRLRTTNMMERLDEEIRRHERVIRVFPNDASLLRLIGALTAEISENWQDRLYFDVDDYYDWAAERRTTKKRNRGSRNGRTAAEVNLHRFGLDCLESGKDRSLDASPEATS